MSEKHGTWEEWVFSSKLQGSINEFFTKLPPENDSNTKDWLFLRNYRVTDETADLNRDEDENESNVETEEILKLVLNSVESGVDLDELKLAGRSVKSLCSVFEQIQPLTEAGFLNFCKILIRWKEPKLLDVTFDSIILHKLKEKEEATLSTINAITELAKEKPEYLCKTLTKLLASKSDNFTDQELLRHVFVLLPDKLKDAIIMTLINVDNFPESRWPLLQALITETTVNSYHDIIKFMESKCEEFSKSQAFAKILVHICKNLQSNTYKHVLLLIAEKNQTLLKRQALKYLSS